LFACFLGFVAPLGPRQTLVTIWGKTGVLDRPKKLYQARTIAFWTNEPGKAMGAGVLLKCLRPCCYHLLGPSRRDGNDNKLSRFCPLIITSFHGTSPRWKGRRVNVSKKESGGPPMYNYPDISSVVLIPASQQGGWRKETNWTNSHCNLDKHPGALACESTMVRRTRDRDRLLHSTQYFTPWSACKIVMCSVVVVGPAFPKQAIRVRFPVVNANRYGCLCDPEVYHPPEEAIRGRWLIS
jgi:hypothetical protein